MKIDKLVIRGEDQSGSGASKETGDLAIKKIISVSAATRGDTEKHVVPLDETDIVEFEFDDGTIWIGNRDTIHEVFEDAAAVRGIESGEGELEITPELYHPGQQRGFFQKILLKIARVFSKKKKEEIGEVFVMQKAVDLEEKLLGKNRGLLLLTSKFELKKEPVKKEGTYLLFLHGTAASANNSFDKLLEEKVAPAWTFIFEQYGEKVLAFQYESLTKSPLQNIVDLLAELPQKVTLHIISQSGGGLVGDILSRFCIKGHEGIGFSAEEKNYLNKQGRTNDVSLIGEIENAIAQKNITVEKFIRVACPASGSSLATSRLDHLLNTLLNVLGFATGLAALPIYNAFRDLIAAVLQTKDQPEILPGVEVLSPLSPVNKMLNNPQPMAEIDSPLIVIAGESKVTFRLNALLVILTKMYYRGANDFIVNTNSMFNGAKRAKGRVQYFLDKGPKVNHFNYYQNPETRDALHRALKHTGQNLIPGFFPLEQRQFTEEEVRFLGLEGGDYSRETVSGSRPIAVILPGIMGSNLTVKDQKIWINYLRFVGGALKNLQYSPENNKNVRAQSIISTSYKKLGDYLKDSYDVVTFPFDWRLQLNESAKALNAKLLDLMQYGQPIKLVAHSMGGVLVRDFIISFPETWSRLNESGGFRLLFLGSPLGGSFRIPFVLFGEDAIINKLAMIDVVHSKKELLGVFSRLPGILSLLPLTSDKDNDFSKFATWKKMRDAFEHKDLPLPGEDDEAILVEFGKYRDNILAKKDAINYANAAYIAGQVRPGKDTPSGYRYTNGKLEFLATKEGDESVTWESGIPAAMVEAGSVYYSDVTHGALANDPALFKAIAEILTQGKTSLLKKTKPLTRDLGLESVAKQDIDFDLTPEGVERTLLGLDEDTPLKQGELPVSVSVVNGDLKYATYPVMAGHFFKDGILYAEQAIDGYLGGELSRRHRMSLYPGEIGSSEIFISDKKRGLRGAIIVGLGKQGELTEYLLTRTVMQATLNYLSGYNSSVVNTSELLARKRRIGISALLIGCSYGGLSIESSVRAILQGVQNANEKIRQIYDTPKTVEKLELVELYRDRALGAVYGVKTIEQDGNSSLNVAWSSRKIKKVPGWRERLPVDNANEWWTRITVRQNFEKKDGLLIKKKGLRFAISTNAAREEERELGADSETVSQMLEDMSKQNRWSPELAKAIFELLIPYDFKEQVKRQNNLNWIVDKYTAAFPWELLQDASANAFPLCVNAGMIRQMATTDYRIKISSVVDDSILVIGDPDLKNPGIQLQGAYREGQVVSDLFKESRFNSKLILRGSAAEIMLALFSNTYKIVHLAGHGVYNPEPGQPSGMLIGRDAYLTTFEISQMSTVPELVFVNCCFLGETDGEAEALFQSRYKLAANIGTELIDMGVKAVVVSGWAVDDTAALQFTETFYRCMFEGDSFGNAVRKARKKIFEDHGHRTNTWGAYQCYGDPFYTLRVVSRSEEKPYSFIIPEEAEIELTNMLNQLDTGWYEEERTIISIQKISAAVDKAGIRTGRITELEALLYSALNSYEKAIGKFESLLREEKASFSFAASEQYCNVRAKYYVQEAKKDPTKKKFYASKMDRVIKDLKSLIDFCRVEKDPENAGFDADTTIERLNIMASTYKRFGMITAGKEKQQAYENAATYYFHAYKVPSNKKKFYSLVNWLLLEKGLVVAGVRKWGKDVGDYHLPGNEKAAINLLKKELKDEEGVPLEELDFWDIVAIANIKLCMLLLGDRSTKREEVSNLYLEAWNFSGHRGNRRAELEQLEFLEDILAIKETGESASLLAEVCQFKATLSQLA